MISFPVAGLVTIAVCMFAILAWEAVKIRGA